MKMKESLRLKWGVVIYAGLATSLALASAEVTAPWISPIYGNDDRQDLYEVTDPLELRLADSTVALIKTQDLSWVNYQWGYEALYRTLGSRFKVCKRDAFFDQNSLADCSGALVGPDLILTAGHCVHDPADCAATSVAFGFSVTSPQVRPDYLPTQEVYRCAGIVGRAEDKDGADFAVIRLDRPVKNHAPLAIARDHKLTVGTPLIAIGHPEGLPTKVAGGAFVRANNNVFEFFANLDTFHGSSGSPVFNARTGLIEGILVDGEDDFDLDSANRCYVDKHCPDQGCRGEGSARVSFAAALIPSL